MVKRVANRRINKRIFTIWNLLQQQLLFLSPVGKLMILKGFTISGLPPPLLLLRNLLLHIASLLKVKTTHTNKPFDIYFVYCMLSESNICLHGSGEATPRVSAGCGRGCSSGGGICHVKLVDRNTRIGQGRGEGNIGET